MAADLRIQVTPKQASVYVDGYLAGQVDEFDGMFQRLSLEAGQHEIAIYLAGYRTLRQLMYLSPNQTRRLSGTLEPLAPGEPDPGPPWANSRLPSDTREPGAQPDTLPPPRTVERDQPAEPRPVPDTPPGPPPATRFGTLSIQVDPGTAQVIVDGGAARTTGSADERLLIQLTDGPHRIEVTKRGYQPFTRQLDIRRGFTETLDVRLERER